ncbi:hypothetical protein C1645_831370 [Glomus cerebriforme]|uniref:Serine-threonine/tyrosine-protein kinase catalytic domain-containing protein n=1 Tax=Glomus cerebriforme TaxID=658196 RepID=A0A397SJH8_9GLOM|nr:hypothetical protein C1645_831370 [Glomus cerebriforme]
MAKLSNDLLNDSFYIFNYEYNIKRKICKGLGPKIANLIMKCWDAKADNRSTIKELCQILKILNKWNNKIIY